MPNPKVVACLAGGGLSVDAGLPDSMQLALKFKSYLQDLASDSKNTEARSQLNLLYFLLGGIRFQRARHGIDPDQPINIEQVATAALRLKHRREDPLAPYVASWNEKIAEFEIEGDGGLDRFGEVIFARLKDWLDTPSKEKIDYINRLGDLHHDDTRVAIFTLNYDLLIETAFANADRKLVNGFENGRWDPRLFDTVDAMRLYKLHGSLDWVDDEMHGICSLRYDRHPRAEDFEANSTPLLIFGTDSKLTGKDPFLTLVHAFAQELRNSTVLLVIGYSFSDSHINEIIAQRMRDSLPLRLVIVSPRADELKQSTPFLENSPRVATIDSGALAALDKGLVRDEVTRLIKETVEEAPF
jgi:SIR2-like domain